MASTVRRPVPSATAVARNGNVTPAKALGALIANVPLSGALRGVLPSAVKVSRNEVDSPGWMLARVLPPTSLIQVRLGTETVIGPVSSAPSLEMTTSMLRGVPRLFCGSSCMVTSSAVGASASRA
ncbi:MAG: hypothetical protein BWX73_01783 [Lentisphaerae bacterium ADurb.Bin082]|nr:MAG: hypothetical protein BWX73_01783 [Lentisphaerae bacterium ADurb.Bin082]